VVNTVVQVVRLLGFPVPQIPEGVFKSAERELAFLKQESSASDFAKLEAKLFETEVGEAESGGEGGGAEALEGSALREFTRFLDKEDPTHEWANLSRVVIDEGTAVWCCERCCKAIKENPKSSFEDLRKLIGSPLTSEISPRKAAAAAEPAGISGPAGSSFEVASNETGGSTPRSAGQSSSPPGLSCLDAMNQGVRKCTAATVGCFSARVTPGGIHQAEDPQFDLARSIQMIQTDVDDTKGNLAGLKGDLADVAAMKDDIAVLKVGMSKLIDSLDSPAKSPRGGGGGLKAADQDSKVPSPVSQRSRTHSMKAAALNSKSDKHAGLKI